jgi:iron complex transport system permease protein
MKIVLDLTRLVGEGKLSAAQAEELQRLAQPETSLLAINILMTLGVVAVAAGVIALLPTPATAIVLGLTLAALGLVLSLSLGPQWSLLGTATTIAAALTASGGVVWLSNGGWMGFAAAAALTMALAIAIRSALLAALTVLALAGLLGSSTGYVTAVYFMEIEEPTVTIALFGLLAWLAYQIARLAPPVFEHVALSFARMSLIMVNLGFWVGSLFGDRPGKSWLTATTLPHIPALVFVIAWALGLLAIGAWAAHVNRRFVVNVAATFGAIHFYTQWFERLGLQPLSLALAGLVVVAVAVALWRYNAGPGRKQLPA